MKRSRNVKPLPKETRKNSVELFKLLQKGDRAAVAKHLAKKEQEAKEREKT